jgi:hypothetical protein
MVTKSEYTLLNKIKTIALSISAIITATGLVGGMGWTLLRPPLVALATEIAEKKRIEAVEEAKKVQEDYAIQNSLEHLQMNKALNEIKDGQKMILKVLIEDKRK